MESTDSEKQLEGMSAAITKRAFKETSYTAAMWNKAREDARNGIRRPPPVYPIIITTGCDGPFSTKENLQNFIGDSRSLKEPESTIETVSSLRPRERDFADAEIDGRRRLQYCTVSRGQYITIQEQTEGTRICIWMGEKRRNAWEAFAFKADKRNGSSI